MHSPSRLGTPLRILALSAAIVGLAKGGHAFTLLEFDWPIFKASISGSPDGHSDLSNKPRYSVSDSGCEVVYTSFQTKLVPGQQDLNFASDVFLFDRCLATITLVSHVPGFPLATANAASDQPVISPDGNFVVFRSLADDIVPGSYFPGATNVFLWNRVANTFMLVSRAGAPDRGGDGNSQNGVISRTTIGPPDDSHFVAFESVAKNLRLGDDNGASDVYRFDTLSGLVQLVSLPNFGAAEANGGSFNPAISGLGTCIVFESEARNLVSDIPADDLNAGLDVFRWSSDVDPASATILLSHKAGLPNLGRGAKTGDSPSSEPSIADDCRPTAEPLPVGLFAFKSSAKDLDLLQNDGNGRTDVFTAENTGDAFLVSHVAGAPPRRAGNDRSESPILSRNGGWVAYASFATDIIVGQTDTPDSSDVFVYEVGRGNTLVSHTVGNPFRVASGPSIAPEISNNGAYVAYVSDGKDLDPNQNDGNSAPDVYHWNNGFNSNIMVSRRYASLAISGERKSDRPALSGIGYSVAFAGLSNDLIADDPDLLGVDDVFHFHAFPLLMIMPHLSVRSSNDQNTLEWITPQLNYAGMVTRVHTVSPCNFPFSDPGWTTLGAPSPPANSSGLFTDPAIYGPGVERCYGIFLARDGNPIQPADTPSRRIVARTLDDLTGAVKWGSNLTGLAALTQVGIGPQNLIGVGNEGGVYGLTRGPSGGFWPSNYWPFRTTNAPIQGRPPILPLSVRGSTRTTFVGSQDGRVYWFDADRGARAGGALLYTSPVLGEDVESGVGGMFTLFGGVGNHLLVGSRNAIPTPAQFYALDPATGAQNGLPYAGAGAIGAINTAPSIDYTEDQVVFTSLELSGAAPSLWCLEVTPAGLGGQCWIPKTLPASISGGPVERNGRVYVGDDAGAVWAFTAATGVQAWAPFTGCGGGLGIKSYVLADRVGLAQDLYYATSAGLCAVTDQGPTSVLKWSISTIPNPSAPILVRIGGIAYLYVGSSNGRLYQIEADNPAAITSVLVRSGATIGAPAFDALDSMIYVGSVAGGVYGVQAPF